MKKTYKKIITAFLAFLFFPVISFAQKDYVTEINKLNEKGNKEGLWIENERRLSEVYYKDGIKSGVFKIYSPKGTLSCLGEYNNGKESGTWYIFGDKGHILFLVKDFKKNTQEIMTDSGKSIPKFKAYTINYYPNGNIESEGTILYWDDFEIDYYEIGEWKYYDKTGKLIKTKILK